MPSVEQSFRALADRTRLRILSILRSGETCVGDLVKLLGISQPQASRHLAYLRRAGLVTVRREGPWAFYSLPAPSTDFENSLMLCLTACIDELPELSVDANKATKLRESGGCCPIQSPTEVTP